MLLTNKQTNATESMKILCQGGKYIRKYSSKRKQATGYCALIHDGMIKMNGYALFCQQNTVRTPTQDAKLQKKVQYELIWNDWVIV